MEADPQYGHPCNGLGIVLSDHAQVFVDAGQFENSDAVYLAAQEYYLQARDADAQCAFPWNNLGNLLSSRAGVFIRDGQFEDPDAVYLAAQEAYRKSQGIDPKDAYPWNNWGDLLSSHAEVFVRADQFDNTDAVYLAAQDAYRKAQGLDPMYASPAIELGHLLKNHAEVLTRAGQFGDIRAVYFAARRAYEECLDDDSKSDSARNGLGLLLSEYPGVFSKDGPDGIRSVVSDAVARLRAIEKPFARTNRVRVECRFAGMLGHTSSQLQDLLDGTSGLISDAGESTTELADAMNSRLCALASLRRIVEIEQELLPWLVNAPPEYQNWSYVSDISTLFALILCAPDGPPLLEAALDASATPFSKPWASAIRLWTAHDKGDTKEHRFASMIARHHAQITEYGPFGSAAN